jgi:protein TonB
VRLENPSYTYFLALSLALHSALLPLFWRKPFSAAPVFEPIAVSFLPEVKPLEAPKARSGPPLPSPRRGELARAKQLKRTAPASEQKFASPALPAPRQSHDTPLPPPASAPPVEQKARPAAVEPPAQSDPADASPGAPAAEASIFKNDGAERSITRGDLLPGRRDLIGSHRPIPLNTSDARYAPYTQTVKQWIEARWEYPDLAKHYGLQGRVVVEFTILQNGQIELLALVHSSGSKLLDEEAVRAIKAAVPFKPFPRSIQETSLRIIAGFVYSDQRLRVSGTR